MAFNLTANLNVALNTGSLRNAVNQVNSSFNNASKLKLGIDRGSFADIGRVKAQVMEASDSMQQFGYQAGLAAKRFAAFTVTAGSIITLTQTMREAVSAAIDFDREMVRLAQVSNDSSAGVQSVATEITRLSTNFGVSSKDLLNVAITLKQANLSLKDTKIALEAMAQAALAPNFDNLKSTTEGAIAIMNQFNVSAKDLGGALGAVNVVAGEFAVEAGDIIEAVRKTGGAFKAAGGNLNELIALFTAVRQTTRESAETIGTGLRTIFTRIQRNDTAEALKQVGIQLRYTRQEALGLGDANLENQFVGPYEAIRRLAQGLEQLRGTDPRFSAIVEQLGGYRQISKVIPLIKEFGIAQKALGIAQAGQASLALNAAQAQDALAIKLQKLKEQFLEVGRGIVNSPGFKSLVDVFITASSAVLKLIDSLKGMLPLIAALGAIKIGKSLAGLTGGFLKGVTAGEAKKASGGFIRMKRGGIVPGSGNGDKVPALLEPGEMVVPKKYVMGGIVTANGKKLKKLYKSLNVKDQDEYTTTVNPEIIKPNSVPIIARMISDKRKNNNKKNWELFEDALSSANKIKKAEARNSFLDFPNVPAEAKFLSQDEPAFSNQLKGNNNLTMLAKMVGANKTTKEKKNSYVKVFYPENPTQISSIIRDYTVGKNKDRKKYGQALLNKGGLIQKFAKGEEVKAKPSLFGRFVGLFQSGAGKFKNLREKAFTRNDPRTEEKVLRSIERETIRTRRNSNSLLTSTMGSSYKNIDKSTNYSNLRIKKTKALAWQINDLERKNRLNNNDYKKMMEEGADKRRLGIYKKNVIDVIDNLIIQKKKELSDEKKAQAILDAVQKKKGKPAVSPATKPAVSPATKPAVSPATKESNLAAAKAKAEAMLRANPKAKNVKFTVNNQRYTLSRKQAVSSVTKPEVSPVTKPAALFGPPTKEQEINDYTQYFANRIKSKENLLTAKAKAEAMLRANPKAKNVKFKVNNQRYILSRKPYDIYNKDKVSNVAPKVTNEPVSQPQALSREAQKALRTKELQERTQANIQKKEQNRIAYEKRKQEEINKEKTRLYIGSYGKGNIELGNEYPESRGLSALGFNAETTQAANPLAARIAEREKSYRLMAEEAAAKQADMPMFSFLGETAKPVTKGRKRSQTTYGLMEDRPKKLSDIGTYGLAQETVSTTSKIATEVQKLKKIKKDVGNPYKPEGGSTQKELFPATPATPERIKAKREKLLAQRAKSRTTTTTTDDEAAKRRARIMAAVKSQMELGLDVRSTQKKMFGFASGGLVPGVGNSDSVPMMLEEGSFVIRKSSVNKIGADRLAKMSRFASGGSVPSLLTPGEYVYTPKEASRIGSGRLHQMNKFAKFAVGGEVSKILSSADFNSPEQLRKIFKQLVRQIINENPTISRGDAISKAKTVMVDIKAQADKVTSAATKTEALQKVYSSAAKGLEQAKAAYESSATKLKALNANLDSLQQKSNQLAQAQSNASASIAANNTKLNVANTKLIAVKAQEAAATSPVGKAKFAAQRAQIEAQILNLTQENAKNLKVINSSSKAQAALAPQITQAQKDVKTQESDLAARGQTVQSRTARTDTAKKAFEQGLEETAKAQKDFQYNTDETGNITRKDRVVGRAKPMRGPGTFDFQTKEQIGNIQSIFGIRGDAAKGLAKQKIADEYQTAIYQQLKARAQQLGKQFDEAELQAAAQDYTQEFQKGNRKAIVKDGKVVGDVGIGKDLTKGSGRFFGYKETGEAKIGTKLVSGAKSLVSQYGATGAVVGANLLASSMRAGAPTAESIVKAGVGGTVDVDQGRADAMRSTLAFSNAVEKSANYAATAGSALAVFGPVVAGVGAGVAGLVGALKGYKDGALDAARQIREAKIGAALENLQGVFERVSNGLEDVNDSTARIISENQKIVSKETGARAFDVAGGNKDLFDRLISGITGGGFQGLDVKQLNAELRKADQQNLANQAVGITNVLNKFSESIGKQAVTDVRVGGGDVNALNFEDFRKQLTDSLRNNAGGFGKEQIRTIAAAKNISIEQAEKEFVKVVQESFNAEKLKQVGLKAVAANERTITSMQALSSAVNAASFASDRFSSRLETNTDLFEGRIGSLKLPNFADQFSTGTPDLNAFNAAISDTSNALGVFGKQFREQGNAANIAAQALPDILAGAVENPISGQEVSVQIADGLREALKQRGVTGGAAETVISSVSGAASGQEYSKLLAEAGGDVGKLSQKLLSGISEPLLQAFKDISTKTNEAANQYIQGLTELANRQRQLIDSYSKLDTLQLQSTKFRARETARAIGLPSQEEELISYREQTQGFRNRQQRLTGFGAGAAEDPQAIASRLRKTQQEILKQEEKVKATPTGKAGGSDFRLASEELVKLKSSAANLQDALKNLTDQSEKVAAAESKLSKIRSDRDTERAFGRKLLTATGEEQQKIVQGQQLYNVAQAQGFNVGNFSSEMNQLLFDFLDNFGPVGKDIADKIVENTTGLGTSRKGEEQQLVQELAQIYKTQEDAQKALIQNQESLQKSYFSDLDSRNAKFFSELQKFTNELQKNQMIAERGREQQKVAKIEDVQKNAQFLGKAGITTKEDFGAVAANRGNVLALANAQRDLQRNREMFFQRRDVNVGAISNIIGKGGDKTQNVQKATDFRENIQRILEKSFDPQTALKISEEFRINLSRGLDSDASINQAISNILNSNIDSSKNAVEKLKNTLGTGEIGDKLRNLASEIASGKIDETQFTRAIDGIKELNLGIGQDLSQAANTARGKIDELNASINNLGGVQQVKPQANQEARAFAVGGKVFTPKGTDTVPAMLTPGEFVVNAKSTRQNLSLLKSINNGTNYLANGGMVGYYADANNNQPIMNQNFNFIDEFIAEEASNIAEEASKNYPTFELTQTETAIKNLIDYKNGIKYDQADLNLGSLGENQNPLAIINHQFFRKNRDITQIFNDSLPKLPDSEEYKNLKFKTISDISDKLIKISMKKYDIDKSNLLANLPEFDEMKDLVYKNSVKKAPKPNSIKNIAQGVYNAAESGVVGTINTINMANPYSQEILQWLRTDEWNNNYGASKYYTTIQNFKKDIEDYNYKSQLWLFGIESGKIEEDKEKAAAQAAAAAEAQAIKDAQLAEQAQLEADRGQAAEWDKEAQIAQAQADRKALIDQQTAISMRKGRLRKSSELGGYGRAKAEEYIQLGVPKEIVNRINAEQTSKRNQEQDAYFLRKKGSAYDLQRILFQRAAQAQTLMGVLAAYNKNPNETEDYFNNIDPMLLFNNGQDILNNLINGNETNIQQKLLTEKLNQSQIGIIASYIKLRSFQNASQTKGEDFLNIFNKYKESARKDPKVIQEQLLKEKEGKFPNSINSFKSFVDAEAEGKTAYLKLLFEQTDKYNISDERIKKFAQGNKKENILDRLINFERSKDKISYATVKSSTPLDGNGDSLVNTNKGNYLFSFTEAFMNNLFPWSIQSLFDVAENPDFERFDKFIQDQGITEDAFKNSLNEFLGLLKPERRLINGLFTYKMDDFNAGFENLSKNGGILEYISKIKDGIDLQNNPNAAKDPNNFDRIVKNAFLINKERLEKFHNLNNLFLIKKKQLKENEEIIQGGMNMLFGVENPPEAQPQQKAKGGLINYLAGGGVPSHRPNPDPSFFKPKGTDTVPAMLTPGEFVVRRDAAQANLPLLHAINSGSSYFASGGSVGGSTGTSGKTLVDNTFKNTEQIKKDVSALQANTTWISTDTTSIYDGVNVVSQDVANIVASIPNLSTKSQISQLATNQGVALLASGGLAGFGTDTVPAMLTPGEFVVNKNATSKNLSLLKSINNGTNYLSKGGIAYLYGGGLYKTRSEIKAEKEKNAENFRDAVTSYWAGGYGLSYYDKNPEKFSEDVKNATNLAAKAAGAGNVDPMARMMANQITSSGLPGADAQESAARQALSGAKIGIFSAETEDVEAMQKMLEDKKALREEIRSNSGGGSSGGFTRPLGTSLANPQQVQNVIDQVKKQAGVNEIVGDPNNIPNINNAQIDAITAIRKQKWIELNAAATGYANVREFSKATGIPEQDELNAIALASGGNVPGYGNSDSVPAMLTPGEFVVNKNAVSRFGLSNLNKINRYANGGLVSYYQDGSNGAVTANPTSMNFGQFYESITKFTMSILSISSFNSSFGQNITLLGDKLNGFLTGMNAMNLALQETIKTIPPKIDGAVRMEGNLAFSIQNDLQSAVNRIIEAFELKIAEAAQGIQKPM